MKFYSTRNHRLRTGLKEALVKGLAPDGGLYMPEKIPVLPESIITNIKNLSYTEIAYEVASALFGDDIPEEDLRTIVEGTLSFDTPIVKVKKNIYSLELFHGPTLAFKDVGARFMARMLQHVTKGVKETIHVLVATSGDTGSAVANGFLGIEGIHVHVLYPAGLVSPLQEKQFTTLGRNITALEVNGSFDDCQKLVKDAFADTFLNEKLRLTSANSINLARFIPQSFYYFNAVRQLDDRTKLVFCVPSGNFGNLTAGLLAHRMGLPVNHFIAATNVNDIVPTYLRTGRFSPRPSIATLANAMDVGNPSNFERILDMYSNSHEAIAHDIAGFSFTDEQILAAIHDVSNETGYLPDPHGATGFLAAEEFLRINPDTQVVVLETAHPAKFTETVEKATGKTIEIPERLKKFQLQKKVSLPMGPHYDDFRKYLTGLI
jgi:threonine synthase